MIEGGGKLRKAALKIRVYDEVEKTLDAYEKTTDQYTDTTTYR